MVIYLQTKREMAILEYAFVVGIRAAFKHSLGGKHIRSQGDCVHQVASPNVGMKVTG